MTVPDPATHVATLPNGVRVVVFRLAYLDSASVSVFIRSGSRNESRRLNGISHILSQVPYKPVKHDRPELPKRSNKHKYDDALDFEKVKLVPAIY